MLSLRDIQQRFVDGLLGGDASAILPHIGVDGLPAAERFAIYRGNCREGFLAALRAGYPVLERLTGEDYFRQLVRDYQREHPSPSGNLFHAGARLPAFLAARFAGGAYDYFSHVAELEWACQEVMAAADHGPLDLERLAAVSPAAYPRLCFAIDPAARLVRSRYPVVRIWEGHQDGREPEAIDLNAGGEQAVVRRRGEGVALYRLPPAEFACLDTFRDGREFGPAVSEALTIDPGLDLRGAMRRWAQLGFIIDFSVCGEPPTECSRSWP